jgi:hypothetical protein
VRLRRRQQWLHFLPKLVRDSPAVVARHESHAPYQISPRITTQKKDSPIS